MLQGEHLWVDKYTPRSFLELLGDEEINREVLKWLKCWDRCVFGETKGTRIHGRTNGGKQARETRPDERILLICGAPGARLAPTPDLLFPQLTCLCTGDAKASSAILSSAFE